LLQGNWLSELCARIEKDEDVIISDYARQLILQTAVAAQFDPHPSWSNVKSDQVSRSSVEDLIKTELLRLAQSDSVKKSKSITYFHVLHWFHESQVLSGWPVAKD
jgi:hypothetical protein